MKKRLKKKLEKKAAGEHEEEGELSLESLDKVAGGIIVQSERTNQAETLRGGSTKEAQGGAGLNYTGGTGQSGP